MSARDWAGLWATELGSHSYLATLFVEITIWVWIRGGGGGGGVFRVSLRVHRDPVEEYHKPWCWETLKESFVKTGNKIWNWGTCWCMQELSWTLPASRLPPIKLKLFTSFESQLCKIKSRRSRKNKPGGGVAGWHDQIYPAVLWATRE